MQTNNLCNPELGRLGRVLPAIPSGAYDIRERRLVSGDMLPRYYSDKPIVLDYRDGMTSLILYQDDTPKMYYLDRIVLLEPDVLFSLAPIGRESYVALLLPEDGNLYEKDRIASDSVSRSAPSLEFGQLYTFFYQHGSENFYFRGESHEPYELVYVDKGCLHNLVDGQDIVIRQQECLIIGRDSWHIQFSDESVSFLTVSFDMRSQYLDMHTNRKITIGQELKPLFEKMARESRQPPFFDSCIESLLKLFLIELIRRRNVENTAAKMPATFYSENEIVNELLKRISQEISAKIELRELADSVHISVPYMYALFDRHIGIPPKKYITKIRIEESKLLLKKGRYTIGEVAALMSFSSIQHFSKQFKNTCGISPSEYLKSLGK